MLQGKVLDEDRPTVEEQSPRARWEPSPEAKAHARHYKTWGECEEGLVPEGLDESSPVRSAGEMMQKDESVSPGTSKPSAFGPRSSASPSSDRSSRPRPGRVAYENFSQHFVLGYFRRVPPGQVLTGQS
jgi:hypothetical protein